MNEIYSITRLDTIIGVTTAIMIISFTAAIAMVVIHTIIDECDKGDFVRRYGRKCKCLATAGLISLLCVVFIPSKKDMLLIYGIGGTIDYIKGNDSAKQLPDKAVKALDMLFDEYIEENDKNE